MHTRCAFTWTYMHTCVCRRRRTSRCPDRNDRTECTRACTDRLTRPHTHTQHIGLESVEETSVNPGASFRHVLLNSTGRCFCARITGPLVFAVFLSTLSVHFGCYGSAGACTNWEVPPPPISWKTLCPTGANSSNAW